MRGLDPAVPEAHRPGGHVRALRGAGLPADPGRAVQGLQAQRRGLQCVPLRFPSVT